MATEKKGMMFILSSPSGAGKTTLTKKLAANNSNFKISISYTTRKPRPNEVNGKDYNFVSNDEFNLLIKKKSFFEYANIFDNCYGTPKQPVLDLLSSADDSVPAVEVHPNQNGQPIRKDRRTNGSRVNWNEGEDQQP